MATVYGFGTAAVDFRIRTADFGDLYKDKLLAQTIAEMGGGAVANFLSQVSRLGGKTAFLGKLGRDVPGKKIVSLLEAEGIDCSHILYSDTLCSPFNVAAYSGEGMRRRCGFLLPNSLASLDGEDISALTEAIRPEDLVMVEIGEIPPAAVLSFMRKVRAKGAKLFIDVDLDPIRQCGFTPKEYDEVCRLSDVLIPNVVSLGALYPDMTAPALAETLFKIYEKPCVVSAGRDGAFFADRPGPAQNVPVYEVEVVDTVGAGDAFHGGFVYGMLSGLPIGEAVRCGCVCGALNCRTFGAREGMARREDLDRALKGENG